MKYVQLGILAALILVAALLGLNLVRDSAPPPVDNPPPSVAKEVPEATDASSTPESQSAESTSNASEAPTVSAGASPASPLSNVSSAAKPAAGATAAGKPSLNSNRSTGSPMSKPSPSAARTAPAVSKPAPAEVAKVDPPSAMPDTRTLPTPTVTAQTSGSAPAVAPATERYEIMRPGSAASVSPIAPEPPRTVTIPAGTILTIRTVQTLSSKSNAAGDTFTGTLDQPLVVEDMVVAERGSRVEGSVTEVTESGRVKGLAQISITLTKINTSDGQTVAVDTQDFPVEAEKTTKSDATRIGIATGIGAALGAIFGGGKGAAIGAASGGAAGAGTVLVSKGKPAEIPSETRINFRLEQPLVLTEKINAK